MGTRPAGPRWSRASCYLGMAYLEGRASHHRLLFGQGEIHFGSRSQECDAGGGDGQGQRPGHELGGADGVLVEVAAQPVGRVFFLWEVLEDFHERLWEDARGSPHSALRRNGGVALTAGGEAPGPDVAPASRTSPNPAPL